MTSVTIGNSVKTLGEGAFSYCTGLASITVPGNVETIGQRAFYGCTSLTSVTINEGVSTIGIKAFYNCRKLSSSIYFPSSITGIGGKAFENVMLDTIYLAAQNPPLIIEKSDAWSTFSGRYYPRYLYVPTGTVDKYKVEKGWKDILYIKENPNETGMQKIISGNETKKIYSLNGEKLQTPSKGINIIKKKDGTVKKVLMK